MERKYKLRVNNDFEFDNTSEDANSLDAQKVSKDKFHILKNNRSFKAEILSDGFLKKSYRIKINSNEYQVAISNELDLLIDEMGLSLGATKMVNSIEAPMPGLILEVNVKPGDEVKEGDFLLVLEAMKMENTITAPRDAVVKTVSVEKGQTVEKNQLLIEME